MKPVTSLKNPTLENPPRYRTYVLTVWEERGRDLTRPAVWRFRLEIARTGKRYGFATFNELVAFLEDQIGSGN